MNLVVRLKQILRRRIVELDIAVPHLFGGEGHHIHQRDPIIGHARQNAPVFLLVCRIRLIEQHADLIIHVHDLGDFPRSQPVREHVAILHLGIGQARHGIHRLFLFHRFDEIGLRLIIMPWQHHSHRILLPKGIVDQLLRNLCLALDRRFKQRVSINIGAALRQHPCHDKDADKYDRHHLSRSVGIAADRVDFGNKVFVLQAFNSPGKDHQQSRHQSKHREKTQQNGLDQNRTQILADPELHKHHCEHTRNRGQRAGADLRNGDRQRHYR